jgi:hypothetical protein
LVRSLRGLGYRATLTSRSLAIALSELSAFGMSGVGIYLGRTGSELSIVRQGQELARIELPQALFVGEQSAGEISTEPGIQQSMRELFATAAFELQRRPEGKALVGPVALAVSGEGLIAPALAGLVPHCIHHASWPFAVRMVRITAEPEWAVSRGCLIQAELEQLAELARSAA